MLLNRVRQTLKYYITIYIHCRLLFGKLSVNCGDAYLVMEYTSFICSDMMGILSIFAHNV